MSHMDLILGGSKGFRVNAFQFWTIPTVRLHMKAVGGWRASDYQKSTGFHGVMASTLDSESSDPSSSLGGTYV